MQIKILAENFSENPENLGNVTLCKFLIYCCIRDSVDFKDTKIFNTVKRHYLRHFKKDKVKYK